ncbi:histidine kinase [Streptosporangium sp. NPDC051023]|uniref:histidine kinase n=1 Tax=Streptosporangium sp. NPDC051023 TaxID=3155410 RepID=UPI00345094A3
MTRAAESPPGSGTVNRSRVADVLVVLTVWAIYVALAVLQDRFSAGTLSVLTLTLVTVSSAALLWRRTQPITVTTVTVVCDCVIVVSTGWQGYGLQTMLALYAAGRHGRARTAWIAAVAAGLFYATATPIIHLVTGAGPRNSGSLGWFVPLLLVGAGRLMRLREENAHRKRVALAEEAVRAERRHISRELHDVVAHNISTMQILIGAARTTMDRDSAGAPRAGCRPGRTRAAGSRGRLRHRGRRGGQA